MKITTIISENRTFKIIVGKNEKENWKIIDDADGDDMWIHVSDSPSCHVIIREELTSGSTSDYPEDVILHAANECKANSKCKNKSKVKIVYCLIKNIKKGKAIGQVEILENPKYINV